MRLIGQTLIGVGDQRLQYSAQCVGHTLDGLRLEQVGGVGEIAANAARRVGEVERQVKARIAAAHRKLVDGQARHTLPAVFGCQHMLVDLELEQRVVAQVTFRGQRIHQVLKRQFLMRLSAGNDLFHLIQQLSKALPLVHLYTQHLSVDEEADQPFQFAAGAPGVGRADANVGLTAEARQHHRQRRQHQHEQGLAAVARLGFQLCGQVFRQIDTHSRATLTRLQRTLVVQRQAQQRMLAAQLLFPVIQLPLALPGFQPGALPDGVVGVLNRQRRQLRGLTGHLRLIQLHTFANQHFAGPAIGHDVMHAHGQNVLGIAQLKQFDPQQGAAQQVEGLVQLGTHLAFDVGGLNRSEFKGDGRLLKNLLIEHAILGNKPCAQGFVALHQLVQRCAQAVAVQRTVEAHRHGNIVSRVVRFHLPEEQHALLSVGQRNARCVVPGHGDGQQFEALPGLVHFGEDLPALFHGQPGETLGDTLCCRLVHVRYPPFHSSFFRYRTSRPRSATGHCWRRPE
ncbi:hypothetical protein ALP64_204261 [Pseudomonas syringae pv. actinidiae]|nr:hypothetical protein ALP64_204261 [Pseudomonas syringae pv. actinidiae]